MKRILFIYNPNAGSGNRKPDLDQIIKKINPTFQYDIMATTEPGDATQIVSTEFEKYDVFVAVGGDGTVNETGKRLVGRKKTLGILPQGSGNGLARELEIDQDLPGALSLIEEGNIEIIDTIKVNDNVCLNVAGIGFDANVAHKFGKSGSRGLWTYISCTLISLWKYKPLKLKIRTGDDIQQLNVFSLSFANSRQFGNNAYIAPTARLDDGLMDVTILNPFPFYMAPILAFRLFKKTLHKSRYCTIEKIKKIEILNDDLIYWHIDGDPLGITGPVSIQIKESSLKVISGRNSAQI